ncbi:MAG TPA: glycosyltransferase family 4 protein [Solirubrobacteraceae bacterium]|nr:glycosyltransferase family 4 protein [Solirubrobacteraceae bacterium]
MVILLLHNRYRERGGEERSVAEQAALLRDRGHRVAVLERSSEALSGPGGRARAARALLRGGESEHEVAALVSRIGAEVVHAHNLHPLFGSRALHAARAAGARTVLQLHNFRLTCAIGVAYQDGAVCHRCSGRNTWPGVRLRCRGELAESVVYAAGLALQQPRILAGTDRFIALSEAGRMRLGALGLPLERTEVISNPLEQRAFSPVSEADRGRYALCVGRLVPEKGFDTAVQAARAAGVPLQIVGRGPDEARLRRLSGDGDVQLLGELEPSELEHVRRGAAVQLAPSRWEEPSPYAVLEAMAAGVPVLVSGLGGLPELAGPEASLPPLDTAAWTRSLVALWNDPEDRRRRGDAARMRAWARAAPERVHAALMGVYERAGARPEKSSVPG